MVTRGGDGVLDLDRDGDGIAGSGRDGGLDEPGGQGTHDAPRLPGLPGLPRARRINGGDPGGGKAGPTPAAAAAVSSDCCPGLQHVIYLSYTRRVAVAILDITPGEGPMTPLANAPPRLRLSFLVLLRCRRVRITMN
jgi:hypothetical protein